MNWLAREYLDWAVAAGVSASSVLCFYQLWKRQIIESLGARLLLVSCLLVGFAGLWLLKSWQIALVEKWDLWSHLSCGICRRWSDVSFWAVITASALSGIVFITTSNPITVCSRPLRLWYVVGVSVSMLIYMILVRIEKPPGTFFVTDSWRTWFKWIQLVEGWIMVLWLVISYYFVWQLFRALDTLHAVDRAVRVVRAHTIPMMAVAVYLILLFASNGGGVIEFMCRECGGHRDPPGSSRILLFQLLLWWPLLIVFIQWIKVVAKNPTVLFR